MATKNITIEIDVYDRLKALKGPTESFSQVLRRSLPRRTGLTSGEILGMIQAGTYPRIGWTDREIEAIEELDKTFLPDGA